MYASIHTHTHKANMSSISIGKKNKTTGKTKRYWLSRRARAQSAQDLNITPERSSRRNRQNAVRVRSLSIRDNPWRHAEVNTGHGNMHLA